MILVSGGCRQRPAAGLAGSEPGAKVILRKASTLIGFTRTGKRGGGDREGGGGE